MKLGIFGSSALTLAGSLLAAGAVAQTSANSAQQLDIPANPEILGSETPGVRKATAIVNGYVITGTDIDHRLALLILANEGVEVPPDQMDAVRAQILRGLVDEALQIQAAESNEIKIEQAEVDAFYARYAESKGMTPEELGEHLRSIGSSERSMKRQIRGEFAWARLQSYRIEPLVNVGEEEVRDIMARLTASKGEREYKIAEIFISATPETSAETLANANRIVEQIRQGAPFAAVARQFSEASTAAVGGDLGWVKAEQLPDPLAEAARVLPVGQISNPIPIPGGFSVLAVQDTRQILMADARDAVLSLKQMQITFPPGMTEAQAAPLVERLTRTAQTMGGCGNAEQAAAQIGATVVSSDQVRVRDLPAALQDMLLSINVGQATSPFGSLEDGVRVLVLCGRDDPEATAAPSFDQIYSQVTEQRVNMRAQRYLRDLRRDAVIDYR